MSLVSFWSAQQTIQAEIVDFPKKPWTFHEKVEWLKAFDVKVAEARKACQRVLQEIEADLTSRPWYDWDWLKHTFTLGYVGPFADKKEEVDTARIALDQAVDGLFLRFAAEVHGMRNEATGDVVAACMLVLQHRPQEVAVVGTLGERFLKEGAYKEAELLFLEVLKRDHASAAYLYLVDALLKLKKYEDAKQKITEWTLRSSPADLKQYNAQFELKRVECQAGQGRFDEAASALFDMIRLDPQNTTLKKQAVQLAVEKEIKKFLGLTACSDAQKAHFMDQARKLYGQLDAYAATQWGAETQRSDIDFWLSLLFSSTEVVNTDKLYRLAIEKFKELVLSEVLSPEVIIQRLEKFMENLLKRHFAFSEAFKALAVEGAAPNRIEALFQAKNAKLFDRLKGTHDCVGLELSRYIARELLDFLRADPRFKENAIQMKIATLDMTLKSGAKEIELCVETAKEQQHRLPAAIEAPPQAPLLAITA